MGKVRNKPVVSIIIPSYNRAHLVGRAIQSVLSQTYQDFELLIVDDGSTDSTEDVVKSFRDERILYVRHDRNKGGAAARNTGIRMSRGKYLAFQDSDDEWLPEKLEKQIKVFQTTLPEVGVVYTDMWRIRGNKKRDFSSPRIMPEDGIVYRKVLGYRALGVGIGSALIKKECFDRVGLLDERFSRYIDFEFFFRLSKYFYFYHINEPLVNYFDEGKSISSDARALVKARKLILEKYFEDIRKDKRLLAKHYSLIGSSLCSSGEMRQGRSYLLKALITYPLNVVSLLSIGISLLGQAVYNRCVEIYRKI